MIVYIDSFCGGFVWLVWFPFPDGNTTEKNGAEQATKV